MSWASEKVDELAHLFGFGDLRIGRDLAKRAIEDAVKEAARRAREADVVEVSDLSSSYYAQLGDARASLQEAANEILAMLEDK